MAKKVNRICTICGIEYKGHTNQKYCEACRPYVYKKETSLPNGFHRHKKKPNKKIKTIREVLIELENYNKEHGTCYTYGQYLAAINPERTGT